MTNAHKSDLLPLTHSTYNAQLFRSALFSDCTIYSKHRVWHLHRCILSPRCEFFWSCFQGSFEEAASATVEMHDDDPETLERMLKWIYHLDYPVRETFSWTRDLMLYLIADKYGLTALMDATRRALLQMADRCASQPTTLITSMDDLAEAIERLYVELRDRSDLNGVRDELLRLLAPVIAKHMRSFPVLEELMTSVPGFGMSLVESLTRSNRRESSSSSERFSIGSRGSSTGFEHAFPQAAKPYIPLNEDSEDELE